MNTQISTADRAMADFQLMAQLDASVREAASVVGEDVVRSFFLSYREVEIEQPA